MGDRSVCVGPERARLKQNAVELLILSKPQFSFQMCFLLFERSEPTSLLLAGKKWHAQYPESLFLSTSAAQVKRAIDPGGEGQHDWDRNPRTKCTWSHLQRQRGTGMKPASSLHYQHLDRVGTAS